MTSVVFCLDGSLVASGSEDKTTAGARKFSTQFKWTGVVIHRRSSFLLDTQARSSRNSPGTYYL